MSVSISETVERTVRIVHYENTNFMGRLHGGDMLQFLTDIGFIAASRVARGTALLAYLDDVAFRKPVDLGDIITLEAEVDYISNSSMEVTMRALKDGDVVVEATGAYVRVDEFMRPTPVGVKISPNDPEEEKRVTEAKARRERRLAKIVDRKEKRFDVEDPTRGIRNRLKTTTLVTPELTYDGRIMSAGKLLKLMDDQGGATVLRFLGYRGRGNGSVVTVAVNGFSFYSPVKVGDIIHIYSGLAYVGNKSADVVLKVVKEDIRAGTREHVATAIFSYVRIGEDGSTTRMPPFEPQGEAERRLYEEAVRRRASLGLLHTKPT